VPITEHREMLEPLPLFIEKSSSDSDYLPYKSRTIQPMQHWEQRDVLKSPDIELAETRSKSEERLDNNLESARISDDTMAMLRRYCPRLERV